MSMQSNGTVKWYNPEKAYGFITTADGQDLFVHRNSIADGRPWLVDGQGVAFTVRQGQKGSEAADVRVTREVEEIPASRQRYFDIWQGGGHGNNPHGGAATGYRSTAPRRSRETYDGPLPSGTIPAKIVRIDPSWRFLFAHAESIGDDVYVHGSLFADLQVRAGDEIGVTIERSDRGLRARSIARY